MDMNGMNQAPQKKGLAIASMVVGIVSLVLACCLDAVPIVLGLVAVILGGICLAKKMGGKGMAIAGLVCGIIGALLNAILLIVGTAILAALGM